MRMIRMPISLDDDDKRWLEQRAREAGTSMSEVIRQSIRYSRQVELLAATKGSWRKGDGLLYQRRIRKEWR
jgi:Ribbon-helix-helix protein, copG family